MPSTTIDWRQRALDFDLRQLPADFYHDPFPTYRALREYDPVHRCPDGSLLLTRYADVTRVYLDPQRFSSDKRREFAPKFGASPLFEHHTTSLVFNDPPRHTRVRRLIVGALTARTVQAMTPDVEALVDGLLDRIDDRLNRDGYFDGVNDFAALIPVEVIGNLLQVPHAEREPLRRWSLAILGALEPAISEPVFAAGNQAVTEFLDYLKTLVTERRRCLGDDLLSRLVRGEDLNETELLHNCIFILNAGHETTTNLIANGIHALLEHPDQLARLRDNLPALIKPAIEELLRYQSPNQLGNRISVSAFDLAGQSFPAGTKITLGIGAANRDPAQFPDPERLDIGRQPNRHVAFATGIHACAGLNVARLEGQIALSRLLTRFPDLALDDKRPCQRSRRARFRGFDTLPLSVLSRAWRAT